MSLAATGTVYAFGLGLVGALNPCGFPLLPAYLSLSAGAAAKPATAGDPAPSGAAPAPAGAAQPAGGSTAASGAPSAGPAPAPAVAAAPPLAIRVGRGLAAAGSVTVGFVAVFAIVGAVAESGTAVATTWVPWVMIPLGAALAVFGVLSAVGRHLRLPALQASRLPLVGHLVAGGRGGQPRSRVVSLIAFGVSYAVASLTCALPVFLAGVAGTFTRSGWLAGIQDFVAYALGMGLLLGFAAVAMAIGGPAALRHIRRLTGVVPRIGGVVLAVVGAYLTYYWVTALTSPLQAPPLVRAVESVQTSMAGWVSSSEVWAGAVLGAGVVAALAVTALGDRSSPRRTPPVPRPTPTAPPAPTATPRKVPTS